MTKLRQLLRDFRIWRKEQYDKKFEKVINDIVYSHIVSIERCGEREISNVEFGKIMLRYGIKHREEILKQVNL